MAQLTVWFPVALWRAIKQSAPKVDPYTSLGKKRPNRDLDLEYHRVLDRDQNPLSFVYHGMDYLRIYGRSTDAEHRIPSWLGNLRSHLLVRKIWRIIHRSRR